MVVKDRSIIPDLSKRIFPSIRVLIFISLHEVSWRFWGSLQVITRTSYHSVSNFFLWHESSDWLWLFILFLSVFDGLILELLKVECIRIGSDLSLWPDEMSLVLFELRNIRVKLDVIWVPWIDLINVVEFILLIQKLWVLSHFPGRTQVLLELLEVVFVVVLIFFNLVKTLRDVMGVDLVVKLFVVFLETNQEHMFLHFKIMLHSGGALLRDEFFNLVLDTNR